MNFEVEKTNVRPGANGDLRSVCDQLICGC